MYEVIDDVLLTQPVTTGNGIVEVEIERVMSLVTAAEPPSAATVWLRIGYTFEIKAIFS